MALVVALLLALYVLDEPWDAIVVAAGIAFELGEIGFWFWYSKRRRIQVGAETLIGAAAVVVTPCRPRGQVRLLGEIWDASCAEGADSGTRVVVVGRDALTLEVEPERERPPA
jgi:membrane-bound serine protease (ClpP class)